MINNLRTLRKGKRWTVAQLSAKSNVPVQAINRMEEVDRFDSFGTIINPIYALMVVRPFGISVDKVFVWEDKEDRIKLPRFYLDSL